MWRRRPFLGRRMFIRGLFFRRFLFGTATILLLGGIAYKLHNDDITKLEKKVGKPAENLSEAELLKAMKDLGIKKLEITTSDNEEIKKLSTE
jgi:hypothetical protein